ncbi:MAG: repair protein RecO [Patescibacteria group bacterium]|nr:repair protein RecO [Patescibacteria group bacterium]
MAIEKHTTDSFVLEGYERAEHDKVFALFTREFGLVLAHAKSIRKLESKLRAHVLPGSMATVTLVKGKDVWRLVGAQEKHASKRFMPEIVFYLKRFMKGEGANKALYDRIVSLLGRVDAYDDSKSRTLLLYVILVSLGYADAKVIGAKDIKEYARFTVDDLYTHLLLSYVPVRNHVISVMKEMQL